MESRASRRRRPREEENTRRAVLVDDEEQSQAVLSENDVHIQVIDSEDSDEDYVQPLARKRSRADLERVEEEVVADPPAAVEEEAEELCTICFDAFTSNGLHRLVSLKCGHFYGDDCIRKWISNPQGRSCPQCKSKATERDIRNHYVAAIKSVDNSEAESLRQSNDAFKRENEGLRLEIVALKRQIEILERNAHSTQASVPLADVFKSFNLLRKHTFVLSKEDGSRAFDVNGQRIVISVKLCNPPISDGFGIIVLDPTLRPIGEKVKIVNRRIRTIEFCPFDPALYLVGGEDSWLMIRSLDGGVRKTVAAPAPVWSSCWTSQNKVVLGFSNGRVLELDSDEMTMADVFPWDSRIGIIHISNFDKMFALVVVSLKTVRIFRHGRITNHLDNDIQEFGKIQDFASLPSHNSFVITFQTLLGSVHKLYRISVDDDENLEVILVSELKTPSKSFSYMWRNALFHFGGILNSVIFQEDFKRVMVHDWSGSKDARFLTMGSSKLTQFRFVPSSATPQTAHILALAEKELHLLQLNLTK